MLILEALILLTAVWLLQRVIRFGRLVYAMRSVPQIPERFPFSLPIDIWFAMKKSNRSAKRDSRTHLPKLRAYPRMFFKIFDNVLGKYCDQPVIGFFYGPAAFISAVTPEAAEAILSSPTNLSKSFTHHFMRPWLGKGLLSNPVVIEWRQHRKLLTPALHFRILDDYRTTMNRCSLRLIEKLSNENNNPFDIMPLMRMTTFAILFESAIGIQLQEDDPEHIGFLDDCDQLANIILARVMTLHHWFDVVFGMTTQYRQMWEVSNRISNYVYKVIDSQMKQVSQRLEGDGEAVGKSYMDILLNMFQRGILSREDVRDHVATFIVGGFDTTGTSLAYTLHLLGNNQDILKRLQLEVDAVLQDSKYVTGEQIKMMPYLDAVYKESLRLFPTVPMITRDLTNPIRVGSIEIPAGPTGLIHIYNLHRNPHVWDRPNQFDPERFLNPTAKRHPYSFLPFSAGPRNCIGQKYALQENKVILAHLVKNFNIKSFQKTEELRLSLELILRPLDGLLVQFSQRT